MTGVSRIVLDFDAFLTGLVKVEILLLMEAYTVADNYKTLRLERFERGETWNYIKGKPRKTYLYVCKLGDRELYRDTNAAFAGAVKKGYEAAEKGKAKGANPYNALDSSPGGATFARAFYKYWNLCYDSYSDWSET